MAKSIEEEIIELKPFFKILGNIKNIESLKSESALTGRAFKVSVGKKSYKLRYCENEGRSIEIENNVRLFPKYLPHFYGRDRFFLLFDWVEGELLREVTLQDCYLLGKMMGEVHELNEIDREKTADDFFNTRIRYLQSINNPLFPADLMAKIERKYKSLIEKLHADVVLEFQDFHRNNIIKDKDGNLLFIDEEGLCFRIKGLGMSKPLLTKGWIKTKEELSSFWSGYNAHTSSDFFDNDYKEFLLLVELIRSISTKIKTNREFMKDYMKLIDFLN